MPMKKGVYLALDTEATGLDPTIHGLIEVACVVLDEKLEVLNTFQTYINPPQETVVDPIAMEIVHITQDQIQSGLLYEEFCHRFIEFVNDNYETKPIAIAQFYPFDYGYIKYVFSVSGFGEKFNELFGNDYIDTKSLVNSANVLARSRGENLPYPVSSLSKEGGLKDILKIDQSKYKSHSAFDDTMATIEVLKKIIGM